MLLGTSGVAYALWSASAALNATAGTATVTVGQALTGSTLAKTYTSSDLIAVGVVTVTNTGTRSGSYSMSIGGTSTSTAFRSAIGVVVGTATTCSTTGTITNQTTGTMAAAVTKTGTLAAGASAVWCVRTNISAANVSANPGVSLAGTATTSITVGTWSASATSIAFTQSIAAPTGYQSIEGNRYKIYNQGVCMNSNWTPFDTLTRGAAAGGSCENDQTSNWRLLDDPSGAKFVARAFNTSTAPTNRWNATSATAVNLATTAATDAQRWMITARPDGTYQFLNVAQAKCLSVTSANVVSLQACNTSSALQSFTFEVAANSAPAPVTLTCGGNGSNYIYYSWPVLDGYQAEVTYKVYVNNIFVKDHTNGYSTSVQFNPTEVPIATFGTGVKTVEVRQSVAGAAYTVTGTGSISIAASSNNLSCN